MHHHIEYLYYLHKFLVIHLTELIITNPCVLLSTQIGLEKDFMKDGEIHMHFPAGAISKDGPSAGVTILTVLVSLLSQRCVRPDVAMTGEITLNGVVLPVSW